MILLFDTATPTFHLTLIDNEAVYEHSKEVGRDLSKQIFGIIEAALSEHNAALQDITGIGVFSGPGSFTGLRIGLTVANTLAESLAIPIVGVSEQQDWQAHATALLRAGENHRIVMPVYGGEAHITKPRK